MTDAHVPLQKIHQQAAKQLQSETSYFWQVESSGKRLKKIFSNKYHEYKEIHILRAFLSLCTNLNLDCIYYPTHVAFTHNLEYCSLIGSFFLFA